MWLCQFLTIIFLVQYSLGDSLSCNFVQHFDGYNCEMENGFNQTSMVPSSLRGSHKFGKGDSDVKVFFVNAASPTKYLPLKVCTFFKHMQKFDIFGRSIVELTSNIFEGCTQTKRLIIRHATFKTFNSDLLQNLINLEIFNVESTLIEVVPSNFFKLNNKLLEINMPGNRIKVFKAEIPKSVTTIILSNNICIDTFTRYNNTQAVIDVINKKCKNDTTYVPLPFETPTQQRISILENSVIEYSEKFNDVETEFENKHEATRLNVTELKNQLNKASENIEALKKGELSNTITDINNNFLKLRKNIEKIHDKSLEINLRVEKSSEFKVENEKLRSSVSRSHHLIIFMLVVQAIVMLYIFGVVGYVKFYVSQPKCIIRHTSNMNQDGLLSEENEEDYIN